MCGDGQDVEIQVKKIHQAQFTRTAIPRSSRNAFNRAYPVRLTGNRAPSFRIDHWLSFL